MPAGVRGVICDGWRRAAVSGQGSSLPFDRYPRQSRGRRWRGTAPRSTGPLKQPSRVFSGHTIRPTPLAAAIPFVRVLVSSTPLPLGAPPLPCGPVTGSVAHVISDTQKPRGGCSGVGCVFWLRGQDLNLRPSGYEPDELPGCSTPRQFGPCRGPAGMRGGHRIREICVSFQVWR